MQIAGVAKVFSDTNLQLLKQLGVDNVVYYNMLGMPTTFEELSAIQADFRPWTAVGGN